MKDNAKVEAHLILDNTVHKDENTRTSIDQHKEIGDPLKKTFNMKQIYF